MWGLPMFSSYRSLKNRLEMILRASVLHLSNARSNEILKSAFPPTKFFHYVRKHNGTGSTPTFFLFLLLSKCPERGITQIAGSEL